MNGTLLRVISAVVAVLILGSTWYFGGSRGIEALAILVIAWGLVEFTNMVFPKSKSPLSVRYLAYFFLLITFVQLAAPLGPNPIFLAINFALYIALSLWFTRGKHSNDQILNWICSVSVGALYFAFLPAFAVAILRLQDGFVWFALLLLLVFCGDTFAYFGGRYFGNKKLMPAISPKKTVAGAWSGLAGSTIGGVALMLYFMPQVPWLSVACFSIICGFVAQAGDLFVSLVKRVADVKDSGSIMPGHGGVLDRLDGVYIAAPLVYGFAVLSERFFLSI